jgi:hypothetical protein
VSGELSVDYSWARPAPAAIRAAGYAGVWRYLSGGTAGKDLTKEEAAALHGAGLGIGCVWETTARRATEGAAAGTADGKGAAAQARSVGLPQGCPLLVNVGDFAGASAQLDVIEAYYHAFRAETEATWQTGGYATAFIIAGLGLRGAQGLWWQNAMDDGGVPGDVVSPHASLYQRVRPTRSIAGSKAGDWDEDIAVGGVAVNWWRPAGAPAPKPAPSPAPKPAAIEGYVVYPGSAGGYAGRAVTSADAGKTWA